MNPSIYIADDEQNTLDLLSGFLEQDGFSVKTFSSGNDLLNACSDSMPDLAVLDIMMPGTDGLSVCSALRQRNAQLPIIIISAKDSSYDRVTGFSFGCDDYIIKPFLPLELSIRIRSLLRRKNGSAPESGPEEDVSVRFGPLELFPARRAARLNSLAFPLSPTEFDFLVLLIKRDGAAVSRQELLDTLWHVNWDANTRATDDLVKRLRRKFRKANSPIRIETVWGYGFRISLGEEAE